eukprot:2700289-Pyramimonas_sp.AAC.1
MSLAIASNSYAYSSSSREGGSLVEWGGLCLSAAQNIRFDSVKHFTDEGRLVPCQTGVLALAPPRYSVATSPSMELLNFQNEALAEAPRTFA